MKSSRPKVTKLSAWSPPDHWNLWWNKTANPIARRSALTYSTQTSEFSKPEESTLRKLKEEPDTVVLPAVRGQITVIMDKAEHISKAKQCHKMFQPILQLTTTPPRGLRRKSTQYQNDYKKCITPARTSAVEWRLLIQVSQFCELWKIHKGGMPLRPKVTSPGTPTKPGQMPMEGTETSCQRTWTFNQQCLKILGKTIEDKHLRGWNHDLHRRRVSFHIITLIFGKANIRESSRTLLDEHQWNE